MGESKNDVGAELFSVSVTVLVTVSVTVEVPTAVVITNVGAFVMIMFTPPIV